MIVMKNVIAAVHVGPTCKDLRGVCLLLVANIGSLID